MREKLEADLFCSLLMAGKVMNSAQIRLLMERNGCHSIQDLYKARSEILVEKDYSLKQKENWKKLQQSKVFMDFSGYVDLAESSGIGSMDYFDPVYPSYLRHLPNMPLVLYYKGDLSLLDESRSRVAIVGTRRPSYYGRRVTREFSRNLALHDVVIISGLARGVDGTAHLSCLECGGKTIAVMPCGLDQVYPGEHKELFERISREGLLLSELAPCQPITRQYFPARNRILSALSDCVLITEAGKNSGTLHTASFAAAQSREVFAVPNTIYSETSEGNLLLLKDGAQIVTEPGDILAYLANVAFFRELLEIKEEYEQNKLRLKISQEPEKVTENEIRKLILEMIGSMAVSTDDIVKELGLPYSHVAKVLGKMELEGKIQKDRQKYVLTIRL